MENYIKIWGGHGVLKIAYVNVFLHLLIQLLNNLGKKIFVQNNNRKANSL